MNKIIASIALAASVSVSNIAKADEGMWILTMLDKMNLQTMQEEGCKLTAEEIYSVNKSSLKDAVIIFGNGCTGEIVSDKGLIFTNHHCGYDAIQKLSGIGHNYLKNGYWSKSTEEDLPVDGLTVRFVEKFENYTDSVLSVVKDDMTYEQRTLAIEDKIYEINNRNFKDEFHQSIVVPFYGGNQYFLIEYSVYRDIRLVGTPPESIGKFGHDTDNWMWPRHTGDFSIFRVYADKNGEPAMYSPDNKPLKPKHYLPISIKGTEIGDYAMTIGFPGSTQRYLTSTGIKERMYVENQAMIEPRGIKQDIWQEAMLASEKINIQYAAKYAHSSNYWKNSIGMNQGIEKNNVIEKKEALEKEFQQWAKEDANRRKEYGNVLDQLRENYNNYHPYFEAMEYLYECQLAGPEIFRFAQNAKMLVAALAQNNQGQIESATEALRSAAKSFYDDYNAETDKKVVEALGEYYKKKIKGFQPSYFTIVDKKYKSSFKKFSEDLFKKSIFANEERLMKFLQKPNKKTIEKDMAYIAVNSIMEILQDAYNKGEQYSINIENLNRLFIKGLMEMNKEQLFYSDANFTMRLSYGTVGDYEPSDAVHYKHFTTLKGVMEKEDPDNWEFIVDPKLKNLYKAKDYGRYADKDGTMHVCFTSNNDITGGNSGSPVINGNGELIGLAFDGNWEAMSGDIAFENKLQKCINVDIRYVLFVIDKYAGARNIIEELKIVE
ncbi:MAG: S46 family peptidase [Bacteroidales bacterium]|nr:S46 family peptidase [Bacteroidales bacterium]